MTSQGPPALQTAFSPAPAFPHARVLRAGTAPPPALSDHRPEARGKFLFAGGEKLLLRGVTYGTFAPGPDGEPYPDDDTIQRDFAAMASLGINAVRTYTPPPARLLKAARDHGLRVLVGLAWETHVAFLDESGRADAVVERARADVRRIARHPAILGYAIGNEIPAGIVRWHGARRTERFLARLARAVRAEDPEGLVTYVSFPTTEYLHLPFLDFVCFNVFLERQKDLRDYVAHLHHVAGDRPLVLTEIGLDSARNGLQEQARSIEWQIRTAFAGGSAGAFVFAWTDAWHRGGHEVTEWDFGVVDRLRRPKPALRAAALAFAEAPFPPVVRWPGVSVVVCSHNGARTLGNCLDALGALKYPDFEVIVVDDGSTDGTAAIARERGHTVLSTGGVGLSEARNVGLRAAGGEIVAYIDDDAFPDADWLTYLAATFLSSPHAGVGGPNVTPREDGWLARCVANAPGGPIHVLLTDHEAEHIPGCNMAFRRNVLLSIGGFDARFRAAGDDVDVCWRLQDAGHTLGFSPGALVWHHRRGSVRAYWRQQAGYGRAEALLEQKWPERYNRSGHLTWSGRLYNNGHVPGWRRGRIYQGVWGAAPFQSVYTPTPRMWWSLPAMPEWHLVMTGLTLVGALGALWSPLLLALPLVMLGVTLPLAQAALGGIRASFPHGPHDRARQLRMRLVIAGLHAIQPLARLRGRLPMGLTPWRRRRGGVWALPRRTTLTAWSETWREPVAWLAELERALRGQGAVVLPGGAFDRWDMEVRFGTLGSARLRAAVEEHGSGRQLLRLRAWPRCPAMAIAMVAAACAIGAAAGWDGEWRVAVILFSLAAGALAAILHDVATALGAVRRGLDALRGRAAGIRAD